MRIKEWFDFRVIYENGMIHLGIVSSVNFEVFAKYRMGQITRVSTWGAGVSPTTRKLFSCKEIVVVC